MTTDEQLHHEEMTAEAEYADYQHRMELQEQYDTMTSINLKSLRPSLAASEQIAGEIIAAIKEGIISPLEFAVKKKCIIDALELAFKDAEVKDMTISEIEKYGKQGASCLGATLKVTSTPKYQYESDPVWKRLNDEIKDQKEAIKAQEEKIKSACKNNSSLVDPETGEITASIVPAPETISVAVSFKSKK